MDEGEFAACVEMRMRVMVGDFAMSGPASMTDARSSGRRLFRHELRQIGDASRAFAGFDMVAVHNRHAGGVVAAIFEAAQTIEQDGRSLRSSDIANNSAHKLRSDRDTNALRISKRAAKAGGERFPCKKVARKAWA